MPATHAQQLAHQLLATVPTSLASQIQTYDWQQAKVVERGKDHVLVIAEGLAVARLPRRVEPELARRTRLLEQLELPWKVPTPLSAVDHGVLQTYIPGSAHAHNVSNQPYLAQRIESMTQCDAITL